ncbi:MAG: hypothetical protein JWP82_2473 [Humibacillus sp.]|nr:hypothetical protein [Humibacillus sp.]
MIAGVVLIAVALGATGHGYGWLFGLFWALPHGGRSGACGGSTRRRRSDAIDDTADVDEVVSGPDPTQDRHEAFRGR